jgi:hypothetical protein
MILLIVMLVKFLLKFNKSLLIPQKIMHVMW